MNDESMLTRWSRRKTQNPEQNELEDSLLEQQASLEIAESESKIEIEVPEDSAPVLTDADMPDVETLTEDSDFSGFMSPGVSDELRNLALRKLFNASVFNVRDGLDEYDEDYTSFEKLGDIITSDMKHQMEMEARKKLEQEQAALASEQLEEPQVEQLEEQPQDQLNEESGEAVNLETPETEDNLLSAQAETEDNETGRRLTTTENIETTRTQINE